MKSCRRLGRGEAGARKLPILVTLPSRKARDKVLVNTRKLKEAGAPYERVFVKKDVHPGVKNEWKRLRDVEAAEKGRPENVGCVIRLDTRERKVYRGLGVMLMGDLNARFGLSVRNIPVRAGILNCDGYTYPVIPDSVERLSHNANIYHLY